MVSFAAIDFETATSSRDSACAIGIAIVDDGEITVKRSWLIKPPGNDYDDFNITIHGITPKDTKRQPSFDRVWPDVHEYVGDRVVLAHNAQFDISVARASANYHEFQLPKLRFACTLGMARTIWPNRPRHTLNSLAQDFGIPLNHHDAESDASAAAELGLMMCKRNETSGIEELVAGMKYRLGYLDGDNYRGFSNKGLG
jgi:DNA polymerase-3 subunit epsilon